MALVSADRVRDTWTGTGTGSAVVSGTAPSKYRTFSAVCSTSDTFLYLIAQQGATNEWEVGLGTYSALNTVARTAGGVLSGSSGAGTLVSFSSGTKDVVLTQTSEQTVQGTLQNTGGLTDPSFGGLWLMKVADQNTGISWSNAGNSGISTWVGGTAICSTFNPSTNPVLCIKIAGWSTGSPVSTFPEACLSRAGTNTLALNNYTLTSPIGFQVYNTSDTFNSGTAPTNYERGVFDWTTTTNQLTIGTQAGGTGQLRYVNIIGGGQGIALNNNGIVFSGASIGTAMQVYSSGAVGIAGNSILGWNLAFDTYLYRDAGADLLALGRGTTTPSAFRVYNTTDQVGTGVAPTNYERGVFDWTTNTNILDIGTQKGGTGTARSVALISATGQVTDDQTGSSQAWALLGNHDTSGLPWGVNVYNVGAVSFTTSGTAGTNYAGVACLGLGGVSSNLSLYQANVYPFASASGFQIYNTFINVTNYERGVMDWTTNSNVFTIGTAAGGTGSGRNLNIQASGNQSTTAAPTTNISAAFAGVTQSAATVTITIASPAVVSLTAHGFVPGQPITFATTGALPTGITAGTTYYVIAAGLTSGAFEISATPGGSAVNTSGSQSGTQSISSVTNISQPTSNIATWGPSGVTGSQTTPALSLQQYWNTSGTPALFRVNAIPVTNPTTGLMMDIQYGGATAFQVGLGASGNRFAYSPSLSSYQMGGGAHYGMVGGDPSAGLGGWVLGYTATLGTTLTGVLFWHDSSTNGIVDVALGTNASAFRVYNTVDNPLSPTNYERGVFDWTTTSNTLTIGAQVGGTGTIRDVHLIAGTGTAAANAYIDGANVFIRATAGSGFSTVASFGGGGNTYIGNMTAYTIFRLSNINTANLPGNWVFGFTSGTNDSTGSLDVGLSRTAAKVIEFGDGGANANGWYQWAGEGRVTSIFSATSNTTLANVTGLTATLQAGRTYSFDAVLMCTTGASAGGIKVGLGGTATVTDLRADAYAVDGTTTIAGTQITTLTTLVANTNAGTTPKVMIWGTITVNAAGTLTIQFAQNATSGTASSVNRGSFLRVYDMP